MKRSGLKLAAAWLLLTALVLIPACTTGSVPKKSAVTLTPAQQEEQDPEFWKIWEERRGLGE
jgi:hypothetical protein